MRETHLRRVPFVPADDSNQSLRARARRRLAALSWTRRHSLRWLVPPLAASAVVNAVLLLSALTEPDEAVTLDATTRSSVASGASKIGSTPTTSMLERSQDANAAASALSITDSPAATDGQLNSTTLASPATARPTTAPPTTGPPAAPAPVPSPPPTAESTTQPPQAQPVAVAPPAETSPAPTLAAHSPTTEPDDDDREDRQEDRRLEGEETRDDRREAREDRGDDRDDRDDRD